MRGFKSASAYREFAKRVRTVSRYIRDERDLEFLGTLLEQARVDRTSKVRKGIVLWRAQLGFDPEGEPIWGEKDEIIDYIEGPFSPERMTPLRDQAREGRVNPQGIPCLYLSTRKETALAEVRPWLHSLISIAQFKTVRELVIVDMSSDARPKRQNYVIPPEEWDKAVWFAVDQAFRKPVSFGGDFPSEYVPTQIIAEFFKANGFDGIAYQSAFQDAAGSGHNVALFDVEAAELINCGLEEVKAISFAFQMAANTYFVGGEQNASPEKGSSLEQQK